MGCLEMIVLDTHVWIWWLSNKEKLSDHALQHIEQAVVESSLVLSSISTWEIAMLVEKNRLDLSINVRDWIRKTEGLSFVQFVPMDNTILLRSVELPGKFHADPADRMIVATALTMGLPIVTKNKKIQSYSPVETIW